MTIHPVPWIMLRIVYAWLYLYPLMTLSKNWQTTVATTALLFTKHAQQCARVSVVVMVIGAISILFGIYARIGGILLLFFNLGGAYIHYRLADQAEGFAAEGNTTLVNLAMVGNVSSAQKNFVLAAVAFFFMVQGSGPWSIAVM